MTITIFRPLLAGILLSVCAAPVSARIPPPPVPLDVLLRESERIVVGHVQPGSVKEALGAAPKQAFQEMTLIVTRALDDKEIGKQVVVTRGSIPAKLFPASKTHPDGRFLLTGWNHHGHVEESETGLDLYVDQIWFLERFRPDRVRDATSAPYGVDHLESVQKLEHADLIELFVRKANVARLKQHIQKNYNGKVPLLALQGLFGSTDSAAGAFVWDYLQEYEALAKKLAAFDKKRDVQHAEQMLLRRRLDEHQPYYAFRTLNSLGRIEAVPWARKLLESETFRGHALEMLKRFQDSESVPRLLQLLKTAPPAEWENFILTLGEIGDRRAIPDLIERLGDDTSRQSVTRALFQLTDVRLSPNGDYAKSWWQRNHDKPRWHWLKQGIEQDLNLMAQRRAVNWGVEFDPEGHLSRATCWRQSSRDAAERVPAWREWWKANKDLPQVRWILDSFKAAGHPLPDLASKEAVDVLVRAFNTKGEYWWDKGPVLDAYLHHAWCQRLLTRLTGWDMEDAYYLHFSRPHYYDYQKFGPRWQAEWQKSRYGVKIRPIDIPEKQPFTMDAEDLRLLCEDFDTWHADVVFKGPLVRKQFPGILGKTILATFEITLTNRSAREQTLHTKPAVFGESGVSEGFGSSLSTTRWECSSHRDEFAALAPGKSIRWVEQHGAHFDERAIGWSYFALHFDQCDKRGRSWRGRVVTPWLSFKNEKIVDE